MARYKRKNKNKNVRTARATKGVVKAAREALASMERELPETRGDCLTGPRPCPYVSCKYNLYFDVNPETGTIKFNFPDLEPEEMKHSCALDIADTGGVTLEVIGMTLNTTRERARQIEAKALFKLRVVKTLREADTD